MSTCASCGAELSGEWKFCLQCGARLPEAIPAAIRPAPSDAPRTLNLLAIVSLVLGVIGGPIAAVFGHISMNQIALSGERGIVLARIGTVLGYVWLAVWAAIIAWVVVVGVN